MNTVPVPRIEHLNPDEIRAYIIADNRLAEKSRCGPRSVSYRASRPK